MAVGAEVVLQPDQRSGAGDPKHVLILFDQHAVFTNTVREHLESFARFSQFRIAYAHASADAPLTFPLDGFDAIIVHYSIRLAYDWHISPEFAWALRQFRGPKFLFIQDEYDHTGRASQWMNQLGLDVVFSCVPPEHVAQIYSKVDRTRVRFLPTLTGYLPIESGPTAKARPLAQRPIVIGYRGRALPFRYGRLGQEKLQIGVRMRQECEVRGIRHDIEWTENKRIYGDAWVDFVASCRATLGTESGSNVFDFDGTLTTMSAEALQRNPSMTYEEFEAKYLVGRELDGVMNQVSPRIFEAVALRTGLILFEGTYSGVVRPDDHFIPLKKDFRNVDEVLRRVQDDRELEAMTDRAYRHVIESGLYTYQTFVRHVDGVISEYLHDRPLAGPPVPAPGWSERVGPSLTRPSEIGRQHWSRLPYRTARFALRKAQVVRAYEKVRMTLCGRRLITGDSVLAEAWGAVRSDPRLRQLTSRYSWFREFVRLALIRQCASRGPTILTPVWVTLDYREADGRLTITNRPVSDMPENIGPGQVVLDRVGEAVRAKKIREIVWDFSQVAPAVKLNPRHRPRPDYYFLGSAGQFRFTALERMADLEPERVARMLGHVVQGAYALSGT